MKSNGCMTTFPIRERKFLMPGCERMVSSPVSSISMLSQKRLMCRGWKGETQLRLSVGEWFLFLRTPTVCKHLCELNLS